MNQRFKLLWFDASSILIIIKIHLKLYKNFFILSFIHSFIHSNEQPKEFLLKKVKLKIVFQENFKS